MLDQKLELLKQVPIFDGLNELQLNAINSCSRKVFFETGETLIAEGQTGDTAYLIVTGKAACTVIEHGEPAERDLWPGTLVGELAMLVETEHAITVTAQERIRALAIQRDALRIMLESDPAIARHFADKLINRLQGLAADLRQLDSKLAEIENAAA